MDADRNLLFGIISMHAGLIDAGQFVEACSVWATHKKISLAELLIDRGLIKETDKPHIEYLIKRRLEKDSDALEASLASVPEAIRRSMGKINDPDIQKSFAKQSVNETQLAETQVYVVPHSRMANVTERYQLTEVHASGGMGRVWRAYDKRLDRSVALKELKPGFANDSVLNARFHREATITGQLAHPGIVPVYDFVSRAELDRSFYTMRLVNGRTLAEAAREFHRTRVRGEADMTAFVHLLNAFVAVCNTIAYAHSRGIIHRDLKGQNVVLGDFGETVVLDWGFAKHTSGRDSDNEHLPHTPLGRSIDPEVTSPGEALGTPAYMAPEQAAGHRDTIDHRTDVYGLGAILYHVLTGEPPFSGADVEQVLKKVRTELPVSPTQIWAEVPDTLEAACLRALAKEPSARFATAAELGTEVELWQEVQRKQAERALRDSEEMYRSLVTILLLSAFR